ncbi:MAG TPA: HAD hydrolase family protein [bacterium]
MAAPVRDTPWRYLLVDVDGTLLTSRGEMTPRSRAALAHAVSYGITLVLATGRTYPSLARITAGFDVPHHAITNGGAVGLGPGLRDVRYVNALQPDVWPPIVEAMLHEGLSPVVYGHRHPEPPVLYVASRTGDPHFESYLNRNTLHAQVVPDLAAADLRDVIEVAALGRGDVFDAASTRVMARFDGRTRHHSMVLFINAAYGKITEFFDAGTSKWHAFLGLFPEAARHPETVIAIGDEANDMEMIQAAGMGIAMGNATPELKAVADRVTADHDHDGLAEVLEALLGR